MHPTTRQRAPRARGAVAAAFVALAGLLSAIEASAYGSPGRRSRAAVPGQGGGRQPPAIFGGHPAAGPTAYPFVGVVVDYFGGLPVPADVLCGATMISPRAALTSASCISKNVYPGNAIEFKVATYFINASRTFEEEGSIVYDVLGIDIHPDYSYSPAGYRVNDAAILFLDLPVNYGDNFPAFATLNSDAYVPAADAIVRALGWGSSDMFDGESPEAPVIYVNPGVLQEVDLTANAACDPRLEFDPESAALCAGTAGSGICYGDSGGPLLTNAGPDGWQQVAIANYAPFGCRNPQLGSTSVFTRVAPLLGWIDRVLALQNGSMTRTTSVTRTTDPGSWATRATPTRAPGRVRVCDEVPVEIHAGETAYTVISPSGLGPAADMQVELSIRTEEAQLLSMGIGSMPLESEYGTPIDQVAEVYLLSSFGGGCSGILGQRPLPLVFDDSAEYPPG
ncbi:trypsin-like cysteine/serine peptidase domain-containing protein [Hyaloraphidium curvatum]|nr:trypsin-like cysteine/serine peptidase domain-containing protein [Hyaloraphidium curvatum]